MGFNRKEGLVFIIGLAFLAVSMQLAHAACYTPSQYAVIDQMASSMNISNTSLRMVFESACGNTTIINNTINATYMNVTNITYAFDYSNLSQNVNATASTIINNYTKWCYDYTAGLVDYKNLTAQVVSIANSSSQFSSFSSALDSAKTAQAAALANAKDELTSAMAAYATLGMMNGAISNLTQQMNNVEYSNNQFSARIDSNWNTTLLLLGAILVVAIAGPVAKQRGWLGKKPKSGDDALAAYLKAQGVHGKNMETDKVNVNRLTAPTGAKGSRRIDELRRAASKIEKKINDERLAEAAEAIKRAAKLRSKGKSKQSRDDDDEDEDEDE